MHKRGAGMKKTALCGVARLPAPPHPEEARTAVSKDGRPLIGLTLRDASLRDAPQHEDERLCVAV